MLQPLFEGIILGLTIAILLGPAFFSLIQTSIHRGMQSGLLLASGIFLSDAFILILVYLGASQIIYEGSNALVFGVIGGVVLIIFGIITFKRPIQLENDEINTRTPGPVTYILKGFFLNLANPFLWIFWMSVVVLVTSNYVGNTRGIYLFFSGVLFTTFVTDFMKCFISHKIKTYLKPTILTRVNHIVGIALVIFGILLIVRVVVNFAGMVA